MPKVVSTLELALSDRPPHQSRTGWLYQSLRSAILEGRLAQGTQLPASRDFAQQHSLSRGIVVSVFERLQSEGYLVSRVGSGTWVNHRAASPVISVQRTSLPAYVRRVIAGYSRPKPFVGLTHAKGARPFQMRDPSLAEFPTKIWAELIARRARLRFLAAYRG